MFNELKEIKNITFSGDFRQKFAKMPRIENHRSMDIARGSHHGLVVPISCTTHFSHILFCFWNPKQKSIEFPSNSKCLCIHVCLLCFDFISINVTSSSHNKAWYLFRYIYVKNWHGMVWELYNVQECSFKGDVYEL